jgi:hypothetical protein
MPFERTYFLPDPSRWTVPLINRIRKFFYVLRFFSNFIRNLYGTSYSNIFAMDFLRGALRLMDLCYASPARQRFFPGLDNNVLNVQLHLLPYIAKVLSRDPQVTGGFTFSWPPSHSKFACGRLSLCYLLLSRIYVEI